MRLVIIIGLAVVLSGCSKDKAKGTEYTLAGESSLTEAQKGQIVARIGDRLITLQEFEKRLNQQSSFARARHNSPSRKQEFLDSMVRFELLALEAKRKGYDQRPDVLLVQKQAMVRPVYVRELANLVKMSDITDADIKAYYDANQDEFSRPAQVRASHILMKTETEASAALAGIKDAIADAEPKARDIFAGFVAKLSTDEQTAKRRGDLLFFGEPGVSSVKRPQNAPVVPSAVARAAFDIEAVGALAPKVIKTTQGFHIIQKTAYRRAYQRVLTDVQDKIRLKLFRKRKGDAMRNYVTDLRKNARITIDEEVLKKSKGGDADAADAQPRTTDTDTEESTMRHLATLLVMASVTSAQADVVDRVVAVVNDDIVTLSELEDVTRKQLGRLNAIMDPVTRDMKRKAVMQKGLDDLVGKALIAQEAARRNLKVEDRQVDAHLKRVQRQQRWTDQQMSMYLTSQGLSVKEFRKEVREQLLQQRVVGTVLGARVRISDSDLENYYKEKRTRMSNDYEVSASHILFKVRAGASADEESAVRQRAEEILESVRASADFAAMARKHSEGPTGSRGGFLGTLRKGTMDPRLEAAVFSTQPGQIEGPVRSPFGYHIIKVLERKILPPRPFAEVKNQLREELHRRKLDTELARWIKELKGKAFIEERL